jgi:hypothetical protein
MGADPTSALFAARGLVRRGIYDAWAKRWLQRWLSEAEKPTIEAATEQLRVWPMEKTIRRR